MYKFIELYGEEEYEETSTSRARKPKEEKIFDLEKYPTMEMKEKKTRYKLVRD